MPRRTGYQFGPLFLFSFNQENQMDFNPKAADQILATAHDTTRSEEAAALHLAACLAALIIDKQVALDLVATVYDSIQKVNQ